MHERVIIPYKEIYVTIRPGMKYRIKVQRKYGKLNKYKLNTNPRYSTIKATRLKIIKQE